MNQEILEYLQSAETDFESGFALFCKYSRNESLMSWIGRKHDMDKLLYELTKLSKEEPRLNSLRAANLARFAPASSQVSQAPAPAAAPQIIFKTYDERRTRRADLPDEMKAIFDRNAEDYKLQRGLHEKMKLATSDADRASFRSRLLEVESRIAEGWKTIDEYLAKQAKEMVTDNFNESTYRAYISKALKRAKNSDLQVATCKARVRALRERGYGIDEKTLAALSAKGLI